MTRPLDAEADSGATADRDERLGEAIEIYLELAETNSAPDPEEFAARYPDLRDDLKSALEGLSLVRGLIGTATGPRGRLESGRRVAGYKIVGELGRGGMGVVYEAVHMDLDRPVALKVLGGHAAPDSNSRRRFLNEARTAAGLHHTHIVPVFDVGQVGGLCYYAMQRIEGSGLDRVLRYLRRDRATAAGPGSGSGSASGFGRAVNIWGKLSSNLAHVAAPRRTPLAAPGADQPLSLPPLQFGQVGSLPRAVDETASWHSQATGHGLLSQELRDERDDEIPPFVPPNGSAYFRWAASVGRMAAEALAFAHQRGIIHRDVKPSNLLVDIRGHVWMTDFGLARRLADPGLTHHDGVLGTPRYMSPEQARTGQVDGRSDVYSLGATLYELLTLQPPFEGKTAAELAEQIRDRDPVAPRRVDPRIPRDLETIVLKALHKRPADRYADAAALADDLQRFLRLEPVRARRISPVGQAWRFARRHPALSLVTTAAAVTVISVVTVAHFQMKRERDDAVLSRKKEGEALQAERTALSQAEHAARLLRAALAQRYASEAKTVRSSAELDRRAKGLDLLQKAAALEPEPTLRAQLRDEAVELLVLRDVEARPGFATEGARALAFCSHGTRLAVLPEDAREFAFWDVETRQPIDAPEVRADGPGAREAADGQPAAPAGKGTIRRRGPGGARLGTVGDRLIFALPDTQGFRVLDAATGAPVCDVPTEGRTAIAVAAAAEGERFVTVEGLPFPQMRPGSNGVAPPPPPPPGEFQVRLWNARPDPDNPSAAPRFIKALGKWTGLASPPLVAISPTGNTVGVTRAGAGGATSIALWSGDDGAELRPIGAQTEPTALAIGPRGRLAVAGGGAVRIWDLDSRTQQPSLNTPRAFLSLLRFSPDGHLLAAAGGGADVELWDTDTHSLVALLPTTDRVSDVAFGPDGKALAAASYVGETAVWSVLQPEARIQYSKPGGFPPPLAFRADGLLAVGATNHLVQFWRPGRGLKPCPRQADAPVGETGEPRTSEPSNQGQDRGAARWNRVLALGFDSQGRLLGLEASSLRVWPDPGKSPESRQYPMFSQGGQINFFPPLARTGDGSAFYSARLRQVFLWRARAPERWEPVKPPVTDQDSESEDATGILALPEETGAGDWLSWHALAVAPRGDRLYLVDNAGDTHAWLLDASGEQALRQEWVLPGEAWNLAISPDGRTLAIGERGGELALVDTAHGTVRARLRTASGETASTRSGLTLAFAPDSRELAVGTPQGQIQIWSVAAPTAPVVRLPGHPRYTTLAYDPDGRYLATGGGDPLIDVWDLPRVRATLDRLGLGW